MGNEKKTTKGLDFDLDITIRFYAAIRLLYTLGHADDPRVAMLRDLKTPLDANAFREIKLHNDIDLPC